MLPVATGLQKTIDNVSVPGLAIWVKNPDGKKLLAQSSDVSTELMSIADMPLKPQVYPVSDRYPILYRGAVVVKGTPLGKVYMAQDVTIEQQAATHGGNPRLGGCLHSFLAADYTRDRHANS